MRNQSIAGRQQLVRLLILAALLLGLSPRPAHAEGDMAAQTFAVNIATDGADAAVGNGICDVDLATAGAQCTLRAAIQEANATAAADTVTLGGRHYQLSLAGVNEDRCRLSGHPSPVIRQTAQMREPNFQRRRGAQNGGAHQRCAGRSHHVHAQFHQ